MYGYNKQYFRIFIKNSINYLYLKSKYGKKKIKINDALYAITNEFMPIKQCNAITIHKSQGQTYNEKVILIVIKYLKIQCFILQ